MTKLDLHYVNPRLVDLYDIENPRGADTDFYIQLAAELDAHHILDLGCGTGLFTRELAIGGRQVVGVDPASAMLAYARRQPGAERVQWVEGDSKVLGTPQADLLIMTSHVAQVFLDDAAWDAHATRHLPRAASRRTPCLREPQPRRPGVGTVEPRGYIRAIRLASWVGRELGRGGSGGERPCPIPGSQYIHSHWGKIDCGQ